MPLGLEAKSTPPCKILSKSNVQGITFFFDFQDGRHLQSWILEIFKFLVVDLAETTNLHRHTLCPFSLLEGLAVHLLSLSRPIHTKRVYVCLRPSRDGRRRT